jgi:hypothetical protein
MGRALTAVAGAASGAIVGAVLLVTTDPTSAYLNDAYRQGASEGFVVRYAALGVAAAFLLRVVRRRPIPAGVGLAILLALAILPPTLDTQTESEKRKAAAVAEDDPAKRQVADFRAGLIDGCVTRVRRDLEGTPEVDAFDTDQYCTCLVDAVVATPGRTLPEMEAIMSELQDKGSPPPEVQRAMERCVGEA